jgi:hypothetical protein
MPEVIFEKEWWKMSKEEYDNGRIAVRSLLNTRDLDVGIKEVSKRYLRELKLERSRRRER